MSGNELRKKLTDEGIGIYSVSKMLGLQTEQNLYSLLRAGDVRSSLIEDLSKVLNKPIGWFYGEDTSRNASASDGSIAVSGDNNSIATISERFIGLLEKKEEQINMLLEILKTKN